ncbi:hypothetical protein BC938DRAFT_477879 [Jimgerdemannia flammicorona]|uniref:Mediator complex subunit 15 KIX domain-containing protein n=1 Tax=Jimgerdemannia flammicorona TaxID=994334 RepID=A0A433QNQ4_9FUNG|nr:hypothetical protein BC938DRAFT_477879 [Jimgerdemannia flammicorona]
MNNSQHAAAEKNYPNWRQTEITVQERAKLVSQLGQALKRLSPSTQDTQIINVARTFEGQIFIEYLTLYSRKFNQIQQQLVIQANQQNQAGLFVTTADGLARHVVDNNGGQSNRLGVNILQQMQAMTTQQLQLQLQLVG